MFSVTLVLMAPLQAAAPPACAATDVALPSGLEGWASPSVGIAMDRAFILPAKDAGATADFTVARAGRYRVALDQPGWIDLVRDGQSLTSVAHGHGPACTTIRKIVDFDLAPGNYTLKLTKLSKPQAKTMLIAAQKE